MATPGPKSIAVVGGGLTGLTAAWRLHRAGHRVSVFEKNADTGGSIISLERDGWLVEGGPNSLQETADVASLLRELKLEEERAAVSPLAQKRYIVRGGRPIMVPLSPAGLLTS